MFPCSHGTKGRTEHTKKFLLCLEGSLEEEMRGSGEPPHCSRAQALKCSRARRAQPTSIYKDRVVPQIMAQAHGKERGCILR